MKTKNMLLSALAALVPASLIAVPAVAQEGQSPQGQVKDAAASKTRLGAPLTFSVEGLTKDNIERVARSLTSLTENVYVCAQCMHEEARPGRCIPCNVDLEAKKRPILSAAVPSLQDANIRLTPFAARTLRYSDLLRTLKTDSVELDSAKFPLAGEARLVLRGGSSEDAKAIDTALEDSKLFDTVNARYDVASAEIQVVVHANATPPMHDQVVAVIDALETKATLADVIWGPLPIPAKT